MTEPNVKVGDWIRYYRDGRLVISEVAYVRHGERWPHAWEACTTDGAIACHAILEVRPASAVAAR